MKIYIRYSKKRIGTALANEIVKPFIVVEGYDITDASQLLKATNYSINSLIREWDKDEFLNTFDFNKKLDEDAGYDLIFIDYYTMRSITENADYLLQAIEWINSQKVNNAAGVREQNVVMGISMGGLVSRYALAKRTKLTGTNSTETKQLLTMDSPHQGANIPLGLQHFLYDFGEAKIVKKIADISDELKAFYNLNTLPATQQQLIARVTDGNGGRANNTFLADGGPYRTMIDYNAPYPFYAVSNGSQCAVPVMQPGTLLLKKEGNVASANLLLFFYNNKYRLNIQVNALPAYGAQAQICSVVMERNVRLFWGLIGTGWTTTSNTAARISPPSTIPWDGVPGGTKSTETTGPISQTSTTPAINQSNTFLGNVWRSVVFLLFNVNANIQLPFSQKDFSFVPITSALDVQNVTASTFSQPFNFVSNGLLGSRANKYISQEQTGGLFNIEHTNFTPRNAQWIYNEMEALIQPISCIDICEPVTGSYQISGPEVVCPTGIYTISGLPLGTVFTWGVSGNGTIASISPNGLSATVTQIGSGLVNVIVTIPAIANCIPQQEVTKAVKVGPPTAGTLFAQYSSGVNSGILLKQINCMEPYLPGSFQANINWYDYVGTNFSWSLVTKSAGSTANFQMGPGNQSATITLRPQNAYATYRLTVTNACGSYQKSYSFNASSTDCPTIIIDELQVSPNPASARITLDLKDAQIVAIRIKDKFGNLVKAINEVKTGSRAEVDLSQLKTDMYIVEVFDGKTWFVKKVIKQ